LQTVVLLMTTQNSVPGLHKYLTGFENYTKPLPFYIEDLFTAEQDAEIRRRIEENRLIEPFFIGDKIEDGYIRQSEFKSRYQPKIPRNMARMLIEFDMPEDCEKRLDEIAKPLYKGDIALCHWNYIDYNINYGYGDNSPALPPHLDADENLVTINYCPNTNIDWDLYVSNWDDTNNFTKYSLKSGQTIVFSAVNQIHWRPKRKFKEGEFCEIISMDYCPTTSYRFTGEDNPIDPEKNKDKRKKYLDELQSRQDMQSAFRKWNEDGILDGISTESMG
jgi:hypothetical protein